MIEFGQSPRSFEQLAFLLEVFEQHSSKNTLRVLKKKEHTNDRSYITMNFLTHVETRKDKAFERGAIYKSITLASFHYDNLQQYSKYAAMILEDYMQLKLNEQSEPDYRKQVLEVLQHYFDKQVGVLSSPSFRLIRRHFLTRDITLCDNDNPSARTLLQTFRENVMVIYREILNEGRVVIVSSKLTLGVFNSIVSSLRVMLYPMHFDSRFYPFETLAGMKLLRFEKSFVAGFNNPIIKFEKELWSLFVNVDAGVMFRSDGMSLGRQHVRPFDLQFIMNIVDRNNISDSKIYRCFYNFNVLQLSIAADEHSLSEVKASGNELEQSCLRGIEEMKASSYYKLLVEEEDTEKFIFKKNFGKEYLNVYQSACFLKSENNLCNTFVEDIDLLYFVMTIERNCQEDKQLEEFLQVVRAHNGLKKFLLLAYSANMFVVECFVRLVRRAEKFEFMKVALDENGFTYSMMLNKLKQN